MEQQRLVYSTDGSARRDLRDKAERAPASRPGGGGARRPAPAPKPVPGVPNDGVVRLFREKGGRGGKTVTVIRGLPEKGPALEARATELKKFCGAGGAAKDGVIEIQGDHREKLAEKLKALGYTVKIAGG